jgi:hypothetical protein
MWFNTLDFHYQNIYKEKIFLNYFGGELYPDNSYQILLLNIITDEKDILVIKCVDK